VTEGLALAPWLYEMNRRGSLGIANCSECQKMTQPTQRQYLGCGYLPPLDDRTRLTLWQPPRGAQATMCAGYTTKLPEVREIQLASVHWESGNIGAAFGGSPPSEDLLNGVVLFKGAKNEVQSWATTPQSEGGGAK
jgi:hypothetical protein